ncbi:hypothetical protein Syun_010820 [Stephania yunnanensis]|uniref:Uncharacterized protein n=1 Tax=Stephania yunnanensis TaxID=152371 RepID=A0AAP0KH72_9MAGN
MGKKKNSDKKQRRGAAAMDISEESHLLHLPQAMDTSETGASAQVLGVIGRGPSIDYRKIKKGAPTKRSKNLRKKKAIEKAISLSEKSEEKVLKNENKSSRTQSAKRLYD